MKLQKGTDAESIIDRFEHHNHHSVELLKLYPDMKIITDGSTMDYYSRQLNAEVDKFQFNKEELSSYIYVYVVMPYKELQISCSKCDGLIRVNSNPSKVPLFFEKETGWRSDVTWYGSIFEEVFQQNNFNSKAMSEVQLYAISKLDEHTKNNRKVDTYFLNNSVKKLLPFT